MPGGRNERNKVLDNSTIAVIGNIYENEGLIK